MRREFLTPSDTDLALFFPKLIKASVGLSPDNIDWPKLIKLSERLPLPNNEPTVLIPVSIKPLIEDTLGLAWSWAKATSEPNLPSNSPINLPVPPPSCLYLQIWHLALPELKSTLIWIWSLEYE